MPEENNFVEENNTPEENDTLEEDNTPEENDITEENDFPNENSFSFENSGSEVDATSEDKNTVATVWMVFSIVWFILCFTVIFTPLGFFCLWLWLILWIIWLFSKPRWRAYVAVWIPLVIFLAIYWAIMYVWHCVKAPTVEFADWGKSVIESRDVEGMNWDLFLDILGDEFANILSWYTEADYIDLMENSSWSNTLEKWAYMTFGLLRLCLNNTLDRYDVEILNYQDDSTFDFGFSDSEFSESIDESLIKESSSEEIVPEEVAPEEISDESNSEEVDEEIQDEDIELIDEEISDEEDSEPNLEDSEDIE